MVEWALIGYLLGKKKGREPAKVDKSKCTHNDCRYWLSADCYAEMCLQHVQEAHRKPISPPPPATK